MVSTRSSAKKKHSSSIGNAEEDAKKINQISSRERRRRQRDELRSKSTGVGISAEKVNRKIIFTDDEEVAAERAVEAEKSTAQEANKVQNEKIENQNASKDQEVDDDENSDVEEMKSSVAREIQEKEAMTEKETSKAAAALFKSRKRKASKRVEETEFTEDFFEQLDAEIVEEKRRKKKKSADTAKGHHTVFHVKSDASSKRPHAVKVNGNIELVVLGDTDDIAKQEDTSFVSEPVSEHAKFYSRGRLVNGVVPLSEKQQVKVKKGILRADNNSGWRRSKKMNLILAPGARFKRQNAEGVAPVHFSVKM